MPRRISALGVVTAVVLAVSSLAAVAPVGADTVYTWTPVPTAPNPGFRSFATAAYVPSLSAVIVVGGLNGTGNDLADTWSFSNGTWTQLVTNGAAPSLDSATMAWDPAINKLVLFGGQQSSTPNSTTYTFDPTTNTWAEVVLPIDTPTPSAASGATMAYDAAIGQIVMFGGYPPSVSTSPSCYGCATTWLFDGVEWAAMNLATTPNVTYGATMAFDPALNEPILFGGESNAGFNSFSNATWAFTPSGWVPLSTTHQPPGRGGQVMVYDNQSHSMIVFGGFNGTSSISDTWSFDGTDWTPLTSAIAPLARAAAIGVFDAATNQVVIQGGANYVGSSVTPLADTWVFTLPVAPGTTAPAAPSLTTLVGGDGTATLSWAAPNDGGSPVTSYNASVTDGANVFSCSTASLSCQITGLSNGVTYTATVTATNVVGTSAASSPLSVIPAGVPDAPGVGSPLVIGDGTITANWTAPANDNGAVVASYLVTASDGTTTRTCTTSSLTCTLVGLTNGSTFDVTVAAINATGPSSPTDLGTATPESVPGAPTIMTVVPGDATIGVSWKPPTYPGGLTVTGYTARADDGTTVTSCTTTGLSCFITGLTNGTYYSVTVVATNDVGNSAASAASSTIPYRHPDAPAAPLVSIGDGQLSISWSAPFNGGVAITGYSVNVIGSGADVHSCTTTSLSCVVSGLTNGSNYEVSVVASNPAGDSSSSPQVAAVPSAKPDAPTIKAVVAQNGALLVSWAAPAKNGGSAITMFTATATDGVHNVSCSAAGSSCTVSALSNNTTYSVSVTATNAAGVSAPSSSLVAFPTSMTKFTAYTKYAVALVGSKATVLVTHASPGKTVTVSLGASSGTCVVSAAGECAGQLLVTSGTLIVSAHVGAVVAVSTKSYGASVHLSANKVKSSATVSITLAGLPPGSNVSLSGYGATRTTTASSTGAASFSVKTAAKGTFTLHVSVGAVALWSAVLTVTS